MKVKPIIPLPEKTAFPGHVDLALLHRAVEALEYKAHMEAGMSQAPDLIIQEETQEWQDAQVLRRALDQGEFQ